MQPEVEGFTYFFRHCWSTRVCAKLQSEGGKKVHLYGYNGMGLHNAHPDWWSLVVRSRNAGLTAQVLSVLGAPVEPDPFINGVPEGCAKAYADCVGVLCGKLKERGVEVPSAYTVVDGDDASTEVSNETEDAGMNGGEEDVADWGGSQDEEGCESRDR